MGFLSLKTKFQFVWLILDVCHILRHWRETENLHFRIDSRKNNSFRRPLRHACCVIPLNWSTHSFVTFCIPVNLMLIWLLVSGYSVLNLHRSISTTEIFYKLVIICSSQKLHLFGGWGPKSFPNFVLSVDWEIHSLNTGEYHSGWICIEVIVIKFKSARTKHFPFPTVVIQQQNICGYIC